VSSSLAVKGVKSQDNAGEIWMKFNKQNGLSSLSDFPCIIIIIIIVVIAKVEDYSNKYEI